MIAAGVPHKERIVNFLAGEHKTPELLAIYPTGQVPFMTVDGETLG